MPSLIDTYNNFRRDQFLKRDLWREARARNNPPPLVRAVQSLIQKIRPSVVPVPGRIAALVAANKALVIDLSSYEPNVDVEGLIDAGVRHFFLRMLYVGQFMMDQWNLTEDPTYRAYFTRITAYAEKKGVDVWISGYIIYCAGVEQADYVNTHIYTDLAAQIMGTNFKPDALWIDDEVDHWWEHNQDTYATAVNQATGLFELRRKLWERFKIVPGYYSGRWFTNKFAAEYTPRFDNLNKPGGLQKTMPIWTAWYPVSFTQIFTNLFAALALLPVPTSTQEVNLLDQLGSFSQCDLWQFTGNFLTPYNKTASGSPGSVDASVSVGTLSDLNAVCGFVAHVTPSPVPAPQPSPDPTPDLDALTARVEAIETKLAAAHIADARITFGS